MQPFDDYLKKLRPFIRPFSSFGIYSMSVARCAGSMHGCMVQWGIDDATLNLIFLINFYFSSIRAQADTAASKEAKKNLS